CAAPHERHHALGQCPEERGGRIIDAMKRDGVADECRLDRGRDLGRVDPASLPPRFFVYAGHDSGSLAAGIGPLSVRRFQTTCKRPGRHEPGRGGIERSPGAAKPQVNRTAWHEPGREMAIPSYRLYAPDTPRVKALCDEMESGQPRAVGDPQERVAH